MFAVQDFDRGNGFPQIAVDARSGDHKHAHLYVPGVTIAMAISTSFVRDRGWRQEMERAGARE